MGLVYANIVLINGRDLIFAEAGYIPKENIKKMTVSMLVDSEAYMMAINERLQ
jgi:hypothetical protein